MDDCKIACQIGLKGTRGRLVNPIDIEVTEVTEGGASSLVGAFRSRLDAALATIQNLKLIGILLVVVLGIALYGYSENLETLKNLLSSHQVHLLNPAGIPRGSITFGKSGPRIDLLDSKGESRAQLLLEEEVTELVIRDSALTDRLQISVSGAGPFLSVLDDQGVAVSLKVANIEVEANLLGDPHRLRARPSADSTNSVFEIIDSNQKVRAVFDVQSDNPSLTLFDAVGGKKGALALNGEQVLIELFDKSLNRRIVSSMADKEPQVVFFDDLSRKRAELSVTGDQPQLLFFDDASLPRQVVGLPREGSTLTLLDSQPESPVPADTIGTLNPL